MNTIKIIHATTNYLDPLVKLFDQYRQFYGQTSNPVQSKLFIKERIENQDSVIFLALDNNDNVLGFVQLYPLFSSVFASRKWILNDLFVAERSRRLGVAKQLLRKVKELAIETDVTSIFLEVQVKNKKAQQLYKAFGYIEETEHYSYFLDVSK